LTKAQLARRTGVTKQGVGQACNHGPLRGAMAHGKVDVDHPECIDWLARRALTPDDVMQATNGSPVAGLESELPSPQAALRARGDNGDALWPTLQDMSVREVGEHFGNVERFVVWLDCTKKIVDIEYRRQLVQERRGDLVRRDIVRQTVFGAFESYHRRLLGDLPRTIAARAHANALSGVPKEESEALIKELISGGLQRIKDDCQRMFKKKGDKS